MQIDPEFWPLFLYNTQIFLYIFTCVFLNIHFKITLHIKIIIQIHHQNKNIDETTLQSDQAFSFQCSTLRTKQKLHRLFSHDSKLSIMCWYARSIKFLFTLVYQPRLYVSVVLFCLCEFSVYAYKLLKQT